MKRIHLTRRAVLKGMIQGTLATVALPPLEAMFNSAGNAYASGAAIPVRMGVFFWGTGATPSRFVPQQTGASWQLSEQLQPLAPVKDAINVVSGMGIRTPINRLHMSSAIGLLTGQRDIITYDSSGNEVFFSVAGPTFDQTAATAISNSNRFKSLQLGIDDVGRLISTHEGDPYLGISHNGTNNMNAPVFSPHALFATLFGASPANTTAATRTSVLDAVLQDVKALQKRVSAADAQRLTQHTESIRQLEMQLATTPLNCAVPADPTDPAVVGGQDPHGARHALMSQLLALALACDQTRVFSYMFSAPCSYPVFWEQGLTDGLHDLTHVDPVPQQQVHKAVLYIMGGLTSLLQTLKSIPEGAGTLLDNCAILATSELAEGVSHTSSTDMPLIFCGGAGGKLLNPGIHFDGNGGNACAGPLTLMQAAGVPITQWGSNEGLVTSPISAIMR